MTAKEINEKYKVKFGSKNTTIGDSGWIEELYLGPYDFVYDFAYKIYGGNVYFIVKNTTDLTEDEIAEVISGGFNFGYRIDDTEVTIYTD